MRAAQAARLHASTYCTLASHQTAPVTHLSIKQALMEIAPFVLDAVTQWPCLHQAVHQCCERYLWDELLQISTVTCLCPGHTVGAVCLWALQVAFP